ncbi:hypothetical protein K450DRAFT_235931 [Umbelopsis ramanniana AG]|uniref:Cyclin-domain-containing protein n=1 Tax=Umbelopsis ramanniana AG TaxID=1314678 RepID=A0AAD5EBQ5_UMBRA|nr:uncharacterized protein K450DRAFT_235931 [Umbelopsis ramanniana AG]KAI8580778.1 hypothetical protein K450DRAFT_235931 [Umbelopsis ramanniana AG]
MHPIQPPNDIQYQLKSAISKRCLLPTPPPCAKRSTSDPDLYSLENHKSNISHEASPLRRSSRPPPSTAPPLSASPKSMNQKLLYVDNLVDTTAKVIEAIWPTVNKPKANVVSLRTFIQEVLKRSRTTYSTLQTALFYLFRVKNAIIHQLQGQCMTTTVRREQDYISCGRRMFLASLILASKFLQDRNYRNSAWAKISGLPVSEINAAEMVFLKVIDCNLFISKATFDQWYSLLNTHIENRVTRPQHPTANNNKPSSQPSYYLQTPPQNIPTSLQPLSPPLSQSSSSPCSTCNTPQHPHDSAVSLSQDNFSPPLSGKLSGKRSYSDEDEASLALKRVKTDKDDFSLVMGW